MTHNAKLIRRHFGRKGLVIAVIAVTAVLLTGALFLLLT